MAKKRVAILGAGASGLVGMKCCVDEGMEPVCFEKTSEIGGLWNYTDTSEDGLACVMKTTVINTSKEMMCYSDYPIPADFPNFMYNRKVYEYFQMYSKQFKLYDYIRFQHEILSVTRAPDFRDTGEWLVEYRDLKSEEKKPVTERFQGVLVCTGHHADKRMPKFDGLAEYKGKVVHTHDYKDHRGYEDQHVVVVGIGNSGGDVAVELSKICKQTYMSTRRGTWVINRVHNDGLPSDVNLTRRITQVVMDLIGERITNKILRAQLNKRFDHRMYGLEPTHEPLSQHPMVNDELPNRLICGTIQMKPNIRRFTPTGVIFEDNTTVEADAVIFATGYKFGFPYLEDGVIEVKDNAVSLYKYAFPPDLQPATLAVIGCVQPWGAINPIAELQCRWACRVFKGATQLPSNDAMWRDIRAKRDTMADRYVASPRHTIQVDWIPFMDDVAREFGAKPNVAKLFLTDPKLALEVLFGPCTPYQYRLQGPGAWSGARDAILNQWDRIYKPFKTRPLPDVKDRESHLFRNAILLLVILVVVYRIFVYYQ